MFQCRKFLSVIGRADATIKSVPADLPDRGNFFRDRRRQVSGRKPHPSANVLHDFERSSISNHKT
jgi:hypothetical protein